MAIDAAFAHCLPVIARDDQNGIVPHAGRPKDVDDSLDPCVDVSECLVVEAAVTCRLAVGRTHRIGQQVATHIETAHPGSVPVHERGVDRGVQVHQVRPGEEGLLVGDVREFDHEPTDDGFAAIHWPFLPCVSNHREPTEGEQRRVRVREAGSPPQASQQLVVREPIADRARERLERIGSDTVFL